MTEEIDMIIERIDKKTFLNLDKDLTKNGFEGMQTDDADELYDYYLMEKSSVRYMWKDKITS